MPRISLDIARLVGEVRDDLQSAGFTEAAGRLSAVLNGTFTTGSEWLAELHAAVHAIRAGHRLPRQLDAKLGQLLQPDFQERVVIRQLWRGILTGTIVTIVGGVAVALFVRAGGAVWIAGGMVLAAMVWISVPKVRTCPGCGCRIDTTSPEWCPYCGTDLTSGITGPKVTALPAAPPPPVLLCPTCGHPSGGHGPTGTPRPSPGHFCTRCGTRLPDAA